MAQNRFEFVQRHAEFMDYDATRSGDLIRRVTFVYGETAPKSAYVTNRNYTTTQVSLGYAKELIREELP